MDVRQGSDSLGKECVQRVLSIHTMPSSSISALQGGR